jgi:hypothetical protein
LNLFRRVIQVAVAFSVVWLAAVAGAQAEQGKKQYVPVPGQPGKSSVWVPTPYATLEKMFDLAELTPQDFVIDLGSGDGRAIIAAAKRGASGVGVEWNDDLLALSSKTAREAGVSERAKFVKHDMFEYDISKATVMALFMLPDQLAKLAPKFLALRPGSRIVMNGFTVPGWTPDVTEKASGDCGSWCTAHLYVVPAPVNGTWRFGDRTLALKQSFQTFTGTLTARGNSTPVTSGRLFGDQISFSIGDVQYSGRVTGKSMSGEQKGGPGGTWSATMN